MIILEGADLAGKSTLANQLQTLGYTIVKCSQPEPGKAYQEYVEKILTSDYLTVFDRHFLGELVYGPIKRGTCQLTDEMVMNIIRLLQARNAKLIYCKAPLDFIKQKFKERGEDYVTIKEIKLLREEYERQLPFIEKHLVVERHSVQQPFAHLTDLLNHHESVIPENVVMRTRYVGSLKPSVVFVGLENNLKNSESDKTALPFDFGKSSVTLKKAIELSGVINYGITNLRTSWNRKYDNDCKKALTILNPSVIVCLGDEVYNELKSDKRCKKVQHPSYVARFNVPIKKYASEIKKVCQK